MLARDRTPANALSGATALLLDTPLTEDQRDLLKIVDAGSSHLVTIVDDVRA